MEKDDGYELGLALFEREIFLTSDEEEEVGPLRRHFVEYGWVGYTGHESLHHLKGIIGFMRGLANDVASDGITANSVLPGLTNTLAISPQSDEQKRDTWNQQAIKRLGEPGDVTGAVLFLTGEDAAFITGQAIVVDGGQYRIG